MTKEEIGRIATVLSECLDDERRIMLLLKGGHKVYGRVKSVGFTSTVEPESDFDAHLISHVPLSTIVAVYWAQQKKIPDIEGG